MELHILNVIAKGIANEHKPPRRWLSLYNLPTLPKDPYSIRNFKVQMDDYLEIKREKIAALRR